ncbi:hypothetical protein NPX13_g8408 [Xylaria arbuscula]|uniref:Uncharacterized protein n=1 Tax=Xylaria arbuscula TaxID=114810 RepID=A0A9W8N8Q8_9PEZI|nr:hypothetical protein NPX13_g8408 [Xylaria arbuscula]
MSSPNRLDGGLLAPPSNPRTPVRNPQNVIRKSIMIEPTPESQQFYNQNRREMDRQRLEQHVEDSNLEPPAAELMSRSTTSDSHPSPSTVCSHSCSSVPPSSPDPTTEPARSKPHRGRRKGPLELETRTKTAFKRKFKLTCAFHRAKRTSCNCHDFSKLEEGYRKYLATEEQKAKATRSHSVKSISKGDIETFSTGGGVAPLMTAQYSSFSTDLTGLSTDRELTTHVNENLLPALNLDLDSAKSYKTEETKSGHSADSCPWTGPFEKLEDHFRTEHHPFQPAAPPEWSMCEGCGRLSPGWDEPCCQSARSTKLFYGEVPRQANPNRPVFTFSEASGSRSSWVGPTWNMATPGSSNTEQSTFPHSSTNSRSGFYDHSVSGKESSESGDGEGSDDNDENEPMRAGTGNRSRLPSGAANSIDHCHTGTWFREAGIKMGTNSSLGGLHAVLTPCLEPYRRLTLSLLAPLVAFYLQSVQFPFGLQRILMMCMPYAISLASHLAIVAIVAFLLIWVAVESLKIRRSERDVSRALATII